MSVIKKIATGLVVLGLVAGVAWLFRGDPFYMIAGKELQGKMAPYPSDWSFSNDYETIAIEVRPDDPHSVTTACFVHDGDLYVPAQAGSRKTWTQLAVEDPLVRIKIGDQVFSARVDRVMPVDFRIFRDSIAAKYPQLAERSPDELPEDIWLFRIRPVISKSVRGG